MKIDRIEVIPVSVPYKKSEVSSVVNRSGITEVLVKVYTDEGHIGWGEAPRIASADVICKAIESMIPLVLNQNPWQNQHLEMNIYKTANWQWSQMTANLAYGAIDMALWDIYGKETNKPINALMSNTKSTT